MDTKLKIYISLSILLFSAAFSQDISQGRNASAPLISIIPSEINAEMPSGKYFQTEIKIFNRGNKTVTVNRVKGSCWCSSAHVLQSEIAPLDSGRILLSVNLEGMNGGNMIEYTIYSNARNNPHSIKIRFIDTVEDSTKTEPCREK